MDNDANSTTLDKKDNQNKKKKLSIPDHLQCPITKNNKLMLDPVMVIDGTNAFTCERDAYLKTYQNKNVTIVSNDSSLKSIQQFIKDNSDAIDLDEDLYFSEPLRDELLSTIASPKDDSKFITLLIKDDRLLIRKLKDDKTLLELVCETGTPKMIEFTLKQLGKYFQSSLPKKINSLTDFSFLKEKKGLSLFVSVSHREDLNSFSEKGEIFRSLTQRFQWNESDFQNALNNAVVEDDAACVTELLHLGCPVDNTLILKAITNKKYKAAKVLLTTNTVQFTSSETATTLAFQNDDIEILKLLLETGHSNDVTLFMIKAINENKNNIIQFLLEQYKHNIDLNLLVLDDKLGRNLFMLAVEKNQIIHHFLIKVNIKTLIKNNIDKCKSLIMILKTLPKQINLAKRVINLTPRQI